MLCTQSVFYQQLQLNGAISYYTNLVKFRTLRVASYFFAYFTYSNHRMGADKIENKWQQRDVKVGQSMKCNEMKCTITIDLSYRKHSTLICCLSYVSPRALIRWMGLKYFASIECVISMKSLFMLCASSHWTKLLLCLSGEVKRLLNRYSDHLCALSWRYTAITTWQHQRTCQKWNGERLIFL